MKLTRLLKTTTFRVVLIYLALFSVSVAFLLGFIYWSTSGIATRQTDDTIQAELTGLGEQYRARGLGGLAQTVRERSGNQRQSLYLLLGPGGQLIAGNLDSLPEAPRDDGGWLYFPYRRPVGGEIETHRARARHLDLGNGFQLLVGRDIQERFRVQQVLQTTLAWAIAFTIAFGLVGGILMSRNLLRRIETINRASNEIMAGDLKRRIPVAGTGDELDRLALNLNAMLDQIEGLVTGMRQVTENIAHDLRTPLNRIRSRLEVTLMEKPGEAEYREALQSTVDEAENLLETFNALLEIARAESGRFDGERESIDLSQLLADMAELYEPAGEDAGVTLTTEITPDIQVDGNRHLLSQAVSNLLDNGIKFTPPGGSIHLVVRRSDGRAEIIVADSGPGIPADQRQSVFDRFVRLESSRNQPGSGLGLSLVRAVARLHDAQLVLDDNLPGLRVSFRFPT